MKVSPESVTIELVREIRKNISDMFKHFLHSFSNLNFVLIKSLIHLLY